MSSRWIAVLLMGLALLVVLLATAPARLLVPLLPANQVVLQGLSGSIWSGRAARVQVAIAENQWFHLGAVKWSLHPASLLTLSPALTLNSQWGRQQVSGRLTFHGENHIAFDAFDAALDAALVREFLPISLVGTVSLQVEHLTLIDRLPGPARARVVWRDGGWLSPQGPRPLGTYVLELEPGAANEIVGNVLTLAGDVDASGPVALQGREYRVDILLSGRGLGDPQLRQALQLMASPEGDGYRIRLQGGL